MNSPDENLGADCRPPARPQQVSKFQLQRTFRFPFSLFILRFSFGSLCVRLLLADRETCGLPLPALGGTQVFPRLLSWGNSLRRNRAFPPAVDMRSVAGPRAGLRTPGRAQTPPLASSLVSTLLSPRH